MEFLLRIGDWGVRSFAPNGFLTIALYECYEDCIVNH